MHEVDLNEGVESTVNIIRGLAKKKEKAHHDRHATRADLPMVTCYAAKKMEPGRNEPESPMPSMPAMKRARSRLPTRRNRRSAWKSRSQDTGCGIPAAIREKDFSIHSSPPSPREEGTGLGLEPSVTASCKITAGASKWEKARREKGRVLRYAWPRGKVKKKKPGEPAAIHHAN